MKTTQCDIALAFRSLGRIESLIFLLDDEDKAKAFERNIEYLVDFLCKLLSEATDGN